jgi:DNA-directed RNA polymerase specialized sigma24 family protein
VPPELPDRGTNGPVEVATDLDRAFAAVQEGDANAFATWLRLAEIPLRASLRSFARALDVEAVLQEGLLRMWVLAPTLTLGGRNASLRYALRLLRNLALDETRRLKRLVPLDESALERLPEANAEPASPPDPALRRAIRACIEQLPRQPRAALEARLASDGRRPDRDLAAALQMQKNTFLQNIVRARRLVAECLERAGVSLAEVLP